MQTPINRFDRLYLVREVAAVLRVAPFTVRKYIREGQLNAVRVGKGYRVRHSDLDLFVNHKVTSKAVDNPRPARYEDCRLDFPRN